MSSLGYDDEAVVSEQEAARSRQEELNDLKMVLESRHGRRVFWRLLSRCNLFRLSFATNATIYYNEGIRSVGLKTLADIHDADSEAYIKMSLEAREDEAIASARLSATNDSVE